VGIATALVILALAILPFLTPAWVGFAQDRADATAWTGYQPEEVRAATDALLHDLVLGPPAFDVQVAGSPVLTERERAHLRDVRGVFAGLAIAAVAALIVLVAVMVGARRSAWAWRAVRRGALGLALATLGLAVVASVAFDAAFEVFHRLFFAGGTYTFDPATERLVQLFPDQLWFETTIAVGVVMLALALLTAALAGRRAGRLAVADGVATR
jgi:integral membrane protein (TIGR01906 family)